MSIYEGEIAFELKEDQSPLTIADKRSNEVIKDFLLKTELPIMSEEEVEIPFEIRKHWDRYWLVDPLDGTKEFIKRNGQFTVNIALIEFGIPVIGVVYAPAIGEIYWTGKDIFSYYSTVQNMDIEPLKLLESANKINALKQIKPFKIVKSLSHSNSADEMKLAELVKGKTDVEIIEMGSSLKICLVAKGVAQLYPRFGPTMEWDTAAGHAIATNAGCKFLNMETQTDLTYNKISLVNPPFLVEA
jgi:3'(2'), 5'-bisphosphate nucleotidase